MNSKLALGLSAGLVSIVGYCIYFDHKRRSDPMFKQKLREKRIMALKEQQMSEQLSEEMSNQLNPGLVDVSEDTEMSVEWPDIPDLRDAEAVSKAFVIQVLKAEELMERGEVDKGVDLLCMALLLSAPEERDSFVDSLYKEVSKEVFVKILERLPVIEEKFNAKYNQF